MFFSRNNHFIGTGVYINFGTTTKVGSAGTGSAGDYWTNISAIDSTKSSLLYSNNITSSISVTVSNADGAFHLSYIANFSYW